VQLPHIFFGLFVLVPVLVGCGSNQAASQADASSGAGDSGSGDGHTAVVGDGGGGDAGVGSETGVAAGDSGSSGGVVYEGGVVPPDSGLPPLPPLSHVQATVRASSARITFDPYPGAVDYRVYVMPQASDIEVNPDGTFADVRNGLYRCAGRRAAPYVFIDGDNGPASNPLDPSEGVQTIVDGTQCDTTNDQCQQGYTATVAATYARSLGEATLGYAFEDSTPGTVPVYAVGDPHPYADAYGGGQRAPQTRSKLYVLDNTSYLAQGWRDDGVVFYAPDSATSTACGGRAHQLRLRDQRFLGT
jgi:hypothetical protein